MKHKPPPRLSSMTHANAVATACTGKAQLTAEVAQSIAARGHHEGRRSAYHCRQCGWFHLGNSIRPKHLGRGSKNASHARKRMPQEAVES